MIPFYHTDDRLLALRFHAGEIVGTPFAKNAMVPGAGIDCVHVNAWCYLKTNFLKDFHPPKYSLDAGSHNKKSQLLEWLDGCSQFQKVSAPAVGGDTICFNLRLSEHHVGLMLDDKRFVHVLPGRQVLISSMDEHFYSRRVTAIYRPMERKEAGDVR